MANTITHLTIKKDISAELLIYSSSGRVVKSGQVNGNFHRLPVEDLSSGLYVIQIVNDEEAIIQRIIKD